LLSLNVGNIFLENLTLKTYFKFTGTLSMSFVSFLFFVLVWFSFVWKQTQRGLASSFGKLILCGSNSSSPTQVPQESKQICHPVYSEKRIHRKLQAGKTSCARAAARPNQTPCPPRRPASAGPAGHWSHAASGTAPLNYQ
jgi:hypothetical protein